MQFRDVERSESLRNTPQRIGSRTRVALENPAAEHRHSTEAGFEVGGRLSRSAPKPLDARPQTRREPLELACTLGNFASCIHEIMQRMAGGIVRVRRQSVAIGHGPRVLPIVRIRQAKTRRGDPAAKRCTGPASLLAVAWLDGIQVGVQAEVVDGTGDATTTDVLIQLAAFGELRCG